MKRGERPPAGKRTKALEGRLKAAFRRIESQGVPEPLSKLVGRLEAGEDPKKGD